MAANDEYWMNLLGPTEGEAAMGMPGKAVGKMAGAKNWLGSSAGKKAAGGLLAWLALSKILGTINQAQERGVQREAIRGQASMATPENLYYQAALPQAQQEEDMARQALFTQISGGVLGPSLASGERLIGG